MLTSTKLCTTLENIVTNKLPTMDKKSPHIHFVIMTYSIWCPRLRRFNYNRTISRDNRELAMETSHSDQINAICPLWRSPEHTHTHTHTPVFSHGKLNRAACQYDWLAWHKYQHARAKISYRSACSQRGASVHFPPVKSKVQLQNWQVFTTQQNIFKF